ncbi:heme exporter protein CcmD [Shewanella sp. WXL01]|uniref:Heme exporter protein D n=1 Tax=Shewanella maritima TaxID=2520507 RepID=A0A411PMZ3_9GAMM|nr:heme exporter protein CcmD [Shewanella maritima]NKF51972.1 heme exporter protein CcmD [Shewanella sp. WXL01]QBF84885.1 heme exporter protein CcmD [Shewanella maritima]
MQFDSISDFFNMGGYGFYVWLAYGVTFSSLAILIVASARRKRAVLSEIATKIAREARLKESRGNKQ